MPGPLDGLLVIDTTWGIPGAIAGMLFADNGATVVKLERPAALTTKAATLRNVLDRSKWSIELDATDPAESPTIDALLARADVLLDSGRAGSGTSLTPEAIRERHPHLVHCLISAYGLDGPLNERPGYDALVAARLGMVTEQSGHRSGPIFLGHPAIAYCTAFLATIGVLGALHARQASGRGQLVDTSLLDGALAANSMNWWWNERNLSYLAREGNEPGFGRNRLITDLFRCGDGEFIMVHTGGEGGFKRTMDLLGLGDKVRAVPGLEMSTPLDDDEYHAARRLVPDAFKSRPRAEWLDLFHAEDIAALPVLRPEQIFEDDQVQYAGIVVEVPDARHGTIRQVGPVVKFHDSPTGSVAPAPAIGADGGRLAGLLEREAVQLPTRDVPSGPPLAGLRVLDFSGFFATAFGARLLSDLGADVIKVEPMHGDQMRPLADLFECAQRGKRNLAIDLRTAEGSAAIQRLVATADVVMHNQRPGKAEKLGIGYEQCRAINPSIIYCYLPGFGSSGPKAELKSFAPLVSGFVGLLNVGAGHGNDPGRRVIGNEDLYNGFLGAVSVLMALQHRDRTGAGQLVESPHLHSGLLVRTEQCADLDGNLVTGLELDADQTGWGPLYRLYRTQDSWIQLCCVGEHAFARLADALGLAQLGGDPRFADAAAREEHGDELAAVLQERLSSLTSEQAFAVLDAADVPVEIPLEYPLMPEFLWDEWAHETDRVFEHQHPEYGWVREVGHCVRFADTPLVNMGTSAKLGQHTRAILSEIGFDGGAIDDLLTGTCSQAAES